MDKCDDKDKKKENMQEEAFKLMQNFMNQNPPMKHKLELMLTPPEIMLVTGFMVEHNIGMYAVSPFSMSASITTEKNPVVAKVDEDGLLRCQIEGCDQILDTKNDEILREHFTKKHGLKIRKIYQEGEKYFGDNSRTEGM